MQLLKKALGITAILLAQFILPGNGQAQTANGWHAEYFANPNLLGVPTVVRTEALLDFEWEESSPVPGVIPGNFFSARWSADVVPQFTETYTLYIAADNAVRVRLDGELIVNQWSVFQTGIFQVNVPMVAGQKKNICVEFAESTGWASIQVYWFSASQEWGPLPTAALTPVPALGVGSSTPEVVAAIQKAQASLRLQPLASGEIDLTFERSLALAATHDFRLEASLDLENWNNVTTYVVPDSTATDFRLPSVRGNNALYSGQPAGGTRLFFRVNFALKK